MQTFIEYIQWWYSRGLVRMFKYLKSFIIILSDTFSVRICLGTLFAPWKRDVASTEGLSLQEKFGVWGFNLLARFFGMFIKTITLIIFLVCFIVLLVFDIIVFFVWLFLPLLLVEGVVIGVMYLL